MRVRARIRAPAPHVYPSSLRPSVAQPHASTPCASSSRVAGAPCARALSTARSLRTDGVFHALTNHKISMPWIEALERSRARTASEVSGGQEQEHIGGGVKDMTPKRMADSFHSAIVPLATDKYLADNYLNASGQVRLGPIFMDLDALSGIITYKHTGEGVTNVTAAVDRITIENPIPAGVDLEYTGQVTFARGSSSMEVTCRVSRARAAGEAAQPTDTYLTITFTLVSLDPATKRSTPNPPLRLETDEERAIYAAGEARSRAKKALARQSLREHHPTVEESALTHKIWLHQLAARTAKKTAEGPLPTSTAEEGVSLAPMSKTKLQSALIMQPQYRNRHSFQIFGGFLLKQTYELAFCCAASFAHAKPRFVSADPCTFLHPVPVGSVLYLTATVVYCDPPLIKEDGEDAAASKADDGTTRVSVRVDGRVRDVEHGSAKPTGQFHYTFSVPRSMRVMPETYQEHMIYIDGRRRAKAYDEADADVQGLTPAGLTE